ncbi:MAG: hypothetical protein ACE5GI_07640, partial [Candidatus Aminicenantales bacterium]
NPELNLSFEYPVDWEIIQPYGRHGLTILGLEHGEERDNIAVGVLSMPNFTLEEIFDMYRKDEKYIVKGSEIKKIGNRTWGILSIYYYRNGYFFHTICPSYYLFIDLYTKSNDTKLLEIPYRMAESLQCGETNATIP